MLSSGIFFISHDTIIIKKKGEFVVRKLSLIFIGLLVTFFVSWGVKVRMPINRPDNLQGIETAKWYETRYTAPVAEDEWILDPEIPDNYIPVAGEDEMYMVIDDAGNITAYRQRTKQEDGSWLWEDVKNPNAESYESVDANFSIITQNVVALGEQINGIDLTDVKKWTPENYVNNEINGS